MIIYSRVTTLPDSEPISLDEAKGYLKVDGTSDDTYITSLITTSRRMCEAYTGLSFVTQERQIKLDRFPVSDRSRGNEITIPYGPVQSIDSVKYLNTDNVLTTMAEGTDYVVDTDSEICRIFPVSSNELTCWPSTRNLPNAVTVAYTAGFDDVSGIPLPKEVTEAMYKQIASMYENRQDETMVNTSTGMSTQLNWNSKAILDSIKVYWNADL